MLIYAQRCDLYREIYSILQNGLLPADKNTKQNVNCLLFFLLEKEIKRNKAHISYLPELTKTREKYSKINGAYSTVGQVAGWDQHLSLGR